MWAIVFLSVVLLYADCASVKNDCVYPSKVGNQADYYWRDYFGVIPNDALLGGYRSDGNITYIGQILQRGPPVGLFPGTIYSSQKEGVICPIQRFADATYVKILCGNPQYKFEWIKTTADESHLFTDYHIIIGGQEETLTYIGRVNFEGEVQVGRVFESKSQYKGLWVCNKAGKQVNFLSFELLVVAR